MDEIEGEFDSLNVVMAAVKDCGDILSMNLDSMRHVWTKLTDIVGIVKMRGEDADKIMAGLTRVNGDPGPDGNLNIASAIMQTVGEDATSVMESLNKVGEAIQGIQANQRAALEILRNWPS